MSYDKVEVTEIDMGDLAIQLEGDDFYKRPVAYTFGGGNREFLDLGSDSALYDPIPDTTPPTAGALAPSVISSTQIDILLFDQSDASGIANITLQWSPNGTNSWTTLVADWDGSVYNHTGRSNGTQYFYRAVVTDVAGNESTTALVNATTAFVPV